MPVQESPSPAWKKTTLAKSEWRDFHLLMVAKMSVRILFSLALLANPALEVKLFGSSIETAVLTGPLHAMHVAMGIVDALCLSSDSFPVTWSNYQLATNGTVVACVGLAIHGVFLAADVLFRLKYAGKDKSA